MTKYIKSKRGFGTIGTLSVIFVFLLLLSGGFFAYQFQKANNAIVPNKEEKTSSAAPAVAQLRSIPSTIDTSSWKTYRNEKYGFEVKYPTQWQEETNKIPASGKVQNILLIRFGKESFQVNVAIGGDPFYREFLRPDVEPKELPVGDQTGKALFFAGGHEGSPFIRITVPYNAFSLIILFDPDCSLKRSLCDKMFSTNTLLGEYAQILSTFKFIK